MKNISTVTVECACVGLAKGGRHMNIQWTLLRGLYVYLNRGNTLVCGSVSENDNSEYELSGYISCTPNR